ncbi:MAG: thioredoxin family protein [Planctomycetes bacterium]|nr:thioredoxin family protein [Planctomycetota bacterium]
MIASTLFAAFALVSTVQEHRPPVFVELGFDEALAKARAEKRIAVLDAMTSWCGPCKQMDATTWRDAGVVKWFADNGLAIQLDMDQHSALKEQLAIKAFPTIIAFRDGVEFDRIVGSRDAAEFGEWLESVRAGKTAKERLAAKLATARAAGAAGYAVRRALVEDLAFGGELDEASREYLWLWTNAAASGRDVAGERHAMSYGLLELARGHAPTAVEFRKLRDALQVGVSGGRATHEVLSDWIALNVIVGETQTTARWAASVADTPAGAEALRAFEERLFDVLVEHGQWHAAGVCLREPVKGVKWLADNLGAYDVAPSGKSGSIPAIPLIAPGAKGAAGGMKPAIPIGGKASEASAGDASKGADSKDESGDPKVVPAIPLTAKPAVAGMVPAVPMVPGAVARPSAPTDPLEIARDVRMRLTVQLRDMASNRYAALLAAGRDAEASSVADTLLAAVDDARSRAALVAKSMRAGVLDAQRARHQAWLDQAAQ